MYKLWSRWGITLSALALSTGLLLGADLTVTVHGHYDEHASPHSGSGTGYLVLSNGEESITTLYADTGAASAYWTVDYVTYYDSYDVWNSETGTYDTYYTERTEPDYSTQRTTYSVRVPDTWVGRSLTFSWAGGYTSYKPFVNTGAEFTFFAHESSGDGSLPVAPSTTFSNLEGQLLIGSWWDDTSKKLLNLRTWENYDSYWPSMGLDFLASRENAFWRWMHPNSNGGSEIAMELDHEHRLTLRRRGNSEQRITLDPVLGQISINGQSVLTLSLANQTYATKSFLQTSLSGYLPLRPTTLNVGTGSSTIGSSSASALGFNAVAHGESAFAAGNGASALGQSAVAMGNLAKATQPGNVAIGTSATATQWESAALGSYAVASGQSSLALGAYSKALQQNAVAIGVGAEAHAALSFASGSSSIAQGYGQTVLGSFNEQLGTTDSQDPESEILIVGSGGQKVVGGVLETTRKNAFTIKRNGNARITGDLQVDGVIRVPEAGDISMGGFTAGGLQP